MSAMSVTTDKMFHEPNENTVMTNATRVQQEE